MLFHTIGQGSVFVWMMIAGMLAGLLYDGFGLIRCIFRMGAGMTALLDALCATHEHPTAEMLYNQLKGDYPELSLGTVYRNLQQMAEDGRLMELDGPVTRFDATVQPHTHLRCSRCGCVADGELAYDVSLDHEHIAQGWQVTGHNLMFMGICPACAGNI